MSPVFDDTRRPPPMEALARPRARRAAPGGAMINFQPTIKINPIAVQPTVNGGHQAPSSYIGEHAPAPSTWVSSRGSHIPQYNEFVLTKWCQSSVPASRGSSSGTSTLRTNNTSAPQPVVRRPTNRLRATRTRRPTTSSAEAIGSELGGQTSTTSSAGSQSERAAAQTGTSTSRSYRVPALPQTNTTTSSGRLLGGSARNEHDTTSLVDRSGGSPGTHRPQRRPQPVVPPRNGGPGIRRFRRRQHVSAAVRNGGPGRAHQPHRRRPRLPATSVWPDTPDAIDRCEVGVCHDVRASAIRRSYRLAMARSRKSQSPQKYRSACRRGTRATTYAEKSNQRIGSRQAIFLRRRLSRLTRPSALGIGSLMT